MDQRNIQSLEIYVPDGIPEDAALQRTTCLGIGAHQDDVEIMAVDGILQAYKNPDHWFTGLVLTSGKDSPRGGAFSDISPNEMQETRNREQKEAARIGRYSAQILMNFSSAEVKDPQQSAVVEQLARLIQKCRPKAIYTHNLFDKHATHVAVTLRVIAALRAIPVSDRPNKLYGCEVWRSLDWMRDEDKQRFDTSQYEDLQSSLLRVFASQIASGKQYDLAVMGRRKANACFDLAHELDRFSGAALAMDLTPLILDPSLDIASFVQAEIEKFSQDVQSLLSNLS